MAKPQPLRNFDATPSRKDAAQNQRVIAHVCRLLEDMLVVERHGEITLKLPVQDGILQNNITVTSEWQVRCP